MAGKAPAAQFSGDDQRDADGFHDPGPDTDGDEIDLGATAAAGMPDATGQQVLPGTATTKVKFVGMAFDALDESPEAAIALGDELVFIVKARCTGVSDELKKADGTKRHVVKMDVSSVQPHTDDD